MNENIDLRGLTAPAPGYIHVYGHAYQMPSSLKHFGKLKQNVIRNNLEKRGQKINKCK